jgi:hypothetical protein
MQDGPEDIRRRTSARADRRPSWVKSPVTVKRGMVPCSSGANEVKDADFS